jgi:hypothetical protein
MNLFLDDDDHNVHSATSVVTSSRPKVVDPRFGWINRAGKAVELPGCARPSSDLDSERSRYYYIARDI